MSGADGRWREPTSLLPLRWGTYVGRYLAGFLFIVAGTAAVAGSNTWVIALGLQGTLAAAIGWAIMPAKGWRRVVAVGPGMLICYLLLAGPQFIWTLTILYVLWLLVRHRPARSWVTIIFPIASGMILPRFFTEYSGMPMALLVSFVVLAISAWLARVLAATKQPTISQ